jgi:hypothetical protein
MLFNSINLIIGNDVRRIKKVTLDLAVSSLKICVKLHICLQRIVVVMRKMITEHPLAEDNFVVELFLHEPSLVPIQDFPVKSNVFRVLGAVIDLPDTSRKATLLCCKVLGSNFLMKNDKSLCVLCCKG